MPAIAQAPARSEIRRGVTDFDPMAVVRLVMVELTKSGVEFETRSVYRLAEAAARLLEQFGVEAAAVGVDLAPVISLRRAVDR